MADINPYLAPQPAQQLAPEKPRDGDEYPVVPFAPATFFKTCTLCALAANVLLAIGGLVFDFQLFNLYRTTESLEAIDAQAENDLVMPLNLLGVGLNLLRLATAGVFITWMYQVHRNLPALGHKRLDSKLIWVVVCWFVPLLNLFCPYQVMREIWIRSRPEVAESSGHGSSALVACWWAAWIGMIVSSAVGNVLDRGNDGDLSDFLLGSGADLVYSAAIILAAALLMAVVFIVDLRQLQRYESLSL